MKKHLSFAISALLFFYLTVIAQNESTDALFIKESASKCMMLVEMGRLAQQRATTQQIKDFGRMMERDYSNANQKLMGVSLKLGMSPPSKILDGDRITVLDFMNKTGSDFEKAFIDFMVEEQKQDLPRFQKAQDEANSSDLKQWVNGTLSLIKEHAVYADNLQAQAKK